MQTFGAQLAAAGAVHGEGHDNTPGYVYVGANLPASADQLLFVQLAGFIDP